MVLSCCIEFNVENIGKFELFDPENNKCEALPDLLPLLRIAWLEKCELNPFVFHGFPFARVYSYSFIKNGPVLLIATELGNFTFDTEQPESCWSRCN